jgi:DNA-binding transcriptional MerR regulator
MTASLLTITAAAHQAGITAGTLRDYERAGLLRPQRDSAGKRLYTAEDVEAARRIAAKRRANRGGRRSAAEAAA